MRFGRAQSVSSSVSKNSGGISRHGAAVDLSSSEMPACGIRSTSDSSGTFRPSGTRNGGVVVLLTQGGGSIAQWRTVPWYALGAGTLGVGVLGAVTYAIPRIGVGTTITLFVAAQLTVGAIVDHFGLFGTDVRAFDTARTLGVASLLFGTWMMVR